MKLHGRNKSIVICDLDGTLAMDQHRHHHLNKPCPDCPSPDPCKSCGNKGVVHDWGSYFKACSGDKLNTDIYDLLYELNTAYEIAILSGRSRMVQRETWQWLHHHNVPYDVLMMREEADRTDDHILKIEWGNQLGGPEKVVCVIEDRTRVVQAWRKAGYTCLQCAQGDF